MRLARTGIIGSKEPSLALTPSPAACSVLNEVQEIEQAALQDVIAVRERVSQPYWSALGHWCCTAAGLSSLALQYASRWGWSTPAQSQHWPAACLQCLCTTPGMRQRSGSAPHWELITPVQPTGNCSLQCLLCAWAGDVSLSVAALGPRLEHPSVCCCRAGSTSTACCTEARVYWTWSLNAWPPSYPVVATGRRCWQ